MHRLTARWRRPGASPHDAQLDRRGSRPTPYHATRRRLALINVTVVSAILLLMAGSIYVVESRALQGQVERQLRDRAQVELGHSAELISSLQAHMSAATPPGAHNANDSSAQDDSAEQYEPNEPNIFSIVLDTRGSTAIDSSGAGDFGLPDRRAAAPVLAGVQAETLVQAHIQQQEYLLYTTALTSNGKRVGALQVGQSLAPMEQQTHDLLLILLLVGLSALAVTAGVSFYLADRALLPMRLAYERQRQFAAAASHELRTPLAFVRSQLELVSRRMQRAQAGASGSYTTPGALTASVREDLDETLSEVDYMTRLVRDLLLLARDQGDHRSVAWLPVDLAALAHDVAETARPSAVQRGLTLEERAFGAGPVWVLGDYDRLRQLLIILLDNAIRYTPTGGCVWLETRSGRGSLLGGRRLLAQVIVGDTGVGIAPEQQERIFEAFYRPAGHSASGAAFQASGDHGGAGLGLALARWLASAHQGDISVTSAPGEGSIFTVTLPGAIGDAISDAIGDASNAASATERAAPARTSGSHLSGA